MKITSLRVLKMDTGISEMNNSPNLRGRLPGGLGERHTGSVEVIGSIPTVSTKTKNPFS